MERFYYRTLDVYKNSKNLIIDIYDLLKGFPREEQYALCDQFRRAATSVVLNIAEGFGRFSSRERLYFLANSNGSLMELSAQIDIAETLGYIDKTTKELMDEKVEIILKQLAGLRRAIEMKQNNK